LALGLPAEAIILHIPHSSTALPRDVEFLLSPETLAYEVDAMTDHCTDKLFQLSGVQRCVFPVKRLVLDANGFWKTKWKGWVWGKTLLTITQKGKATKALKHNRFDVEAMAHLHRTITQADKQILARDTSSLKVDC